MGNATTSLSAGRCDRFPANFAGSAIGGRMRIRVRGTPALGDRFSCRMFPTAPLGARSSNASRAGRSEKPACPRRYVAERLGLSLAGQDFGWLDELMRSGVFEFVFEFIPVVDELYG